MRQRKRWRKRSLGAVLGLALGWVAAGYAPGALHGTPDAPDPREPQTERQPEMDTPGHNESVHDKSDDAPAEK